MLFVLVKAKATKDVEDERRKGRKSKVSSKRERERGKARKSRKLNALTNQEEGVVPLVQENGR